MNVFRGCVRVSPLFLLAFPFHVLFYRLSSLLQHAAERPLLSRNINLIWFDAIIIIFHNNTVEHGRNMKGKRRLKNKTKSVSAGNWGRWVHWKISGKKETKEPTICRWWVGIDKSGSKIAEYSLCRRPGPTRVQRYASIFPRITFFFNLCSLSIHFKNRLALNL